MNIAVIDLGSNSVRMTVYSLMPDGKYKALLNLRETVRLGQGMKDGMLDAEAIKRVVGVLKKFHIAAEAAFADEIIATATAAVRIAKNRDEFLRVARETADLEFTVLSGEEEAYCSFLAVRETLPIDNGLIFDTGGGSTELMLVKNRELVKSVSTPCGAVMLTEKFSDAKPLYDEVKTVLSEVDFFGEAAGLPLYGVGGSARALADICGKKPEQALNGFEISRRAINWAYKTISETPPEKRADIENMDKSRADIILAGITPLKVMADVLDSPKLVVCEYGVREGVFFRRKNQIIKLHPVFNVVLVEPEIPQNTGNIARTCAAAGCALHLVKPLGFEISDKTLKRAGLDYWSLLDVKYYENLDDFFRKNPDGRYFYATTKGEKSYADAQYNEGDYILFGKETKGLPEELLKAHLERCVRIPMNPAARSLNLGNSAAIIIYEALRQNDFFNLKQISDYLTEE